MQGSDVRKKISIVYVIVVSIVCIALVIYTLVNMFGRKYEVEHYPVLTTEQAILGSMKEDLQMYIVANAPLRGEIVVDTYGDLPRKYDIPSDKILYLRYIEEEVKERSTDDGTEYYWDVVNTVEFASNDFYIYDNLYTLGSLRNYTPIENINKVVDYPTSMGQKKTKGNRRTTLEYITTEDTVTFIVKAGNGSYIPYPAVKHTYFYLNSGVDTIANSIGEQCTIKVIILLVLGLFIGILGYIMIAGGARVHY